MQNTFEVKNLSVAVANQDIVKDVSFSISSGSVTALMGPNGSGKSTLAFGLVGHPDYQVVNGEIIIGGIDISDLSPDERARNGLFLAFQNPPEISGVKLFNFLYLSYKQIHQVTISATDFLALVKTNCQFLEMDPIFLERSVNEGFSGGEKKKAELLQLLTLSPAFAILDETDSGLDIDALKLVGKVIKKLIAGPTGTGVLLITHYPKLLEYVMPDSVLVMKGGKIVKSGDASLVHQLEEAGFADLETNNG